ncbi:MAG TPA: HD domain-containing phosphohydrolase [Vicinamibacterales bacterium]|nr:HD domain-containing phosphohydrolase [Vicinamibacterales bacterium]
MSRGVVLVVDDYEPNLSGLRSLLEDAGYDVRTATNGCEALQSATEQPPDLVLLDVVMPGMSGVEVCRALKQYPSTRLLPIILISGTHDRANRLAGLEQGADDFLNKPIDPDELRTRVRSLIRVKRLTDDLESADTLFETLGRIVEARDPNTEGHCERLAHSATALGAAVGVDAAGLDALRRGASLHDVGKIGVPDSVLLKPGRLTPDEYQLMKEHPAIGDRLCSTVRSLDGVRPIVRHHHERLDGRGYPDGLAGEEIPLLAQIVSVVDVFDALTTDRPYRQRLPVSTAYEMLRAEADGGWCPRDLVESFLELHQTLPPVSADYTFFPAIASVPQALADLMARLAPSGIAIFGGPWPQLQGPAASHAASAKPAAGLPPTAIRGRVRAANRRKRA